jgi:DNA replication protein DnaC
MNKLDIKTQFDMIESKPPKCKICLDTGLYFPAGFDKGVTMCDCKRQEKLDSLTKQLPADYRDVYFKNGFLYKGAKRLGLQLLEEKRYLENLRENITDGKGLTWQGVNRTGKSTRTAAVCQAINEVYWRNMDLAFYNDIMLVSMLRSEEFGGPAVLDFIRHATVLFIDDFGASKPSEWVSSALYGVIEERRSQKRPVFITTNYSSKQISERLERGAAITGRLREVNMVITLNEKR